VFPSFQSAPGGRIMRLAGFIGYDRGNQSDSMIGWRRLFQSALLPRHISFSALTYHNEGRSFIHSNTTADEIRSIYRTTLCASRSSLPVLGRGQHLAHCPVQHRPRYLRHSSQLMDSSRFWGIFWFAKLQSWSEPLAEMPDKTPSLCTSWPFEYMP
jgi:hypothetical protein